MITEAVQSVLDDITTRCYPHAAPMNATVPFILHIESGEPIRSKNGLEGYSYDCNVVIVTADPKTMETYTSQAITKIEALTGTTTNSTTVDEALYVSDVPIYNEEVGLFGNNILFRIITSNR